MNEANQPTTITVRALLAHFHGILAEARRTGAPVIIALRRRTPAGVLLGYEAWQASQAQALGQADTSALQAELAAERQRSASLTADLAAARQQVAELGRDLAAARQRVLELEAQLVKPQPAGEAGAAWGVAPPPAAPARLPETWAGQSWGVSPLPDPPTRPGQR